nr:RNA-directed DNA polymerase, eukaryota [Tanacetum cinerariifolium]
MHNLGWPFKTARKYSEFQRKPLNEMSTSAKTVGENNRGGDEFSRSFGGAMGNDNSYINVLKSSNGVGRLESHSPDIVLDDVCVIYKELSYSLMDRVKEFSLLTNLKTALLNEGFADLSVRYLGELWVLLEFSSSKTKEVFRVNVGVSSWFSKIRQASMDIIPDGRIVWVEVEGVPLKLWSMNTFKRIATKWGDLIDVDYIDESYFHSKRLCLYTKSSLKIYENFKIIFTGKVFWIRAKEVPGWVLDLKEESEEEEQSDVVSLEGNNNMNEDDLCGDNMDMVDVPETVFDESNGQKKDVSQDPFGNYPMLNKKTNEKNDKDHSPKYPSGFTPNEETNVNSGIKDKSVNYNADEGTIGGDGVFLNVNSKGDDVDSVSIGHFKKFEALRSGGSFLCLMEEVVKVGQTMRYNTEGVVNNLSDIIESHGESLMSLVKNGIDLTIIAVYAPHDLRDKFMLWEYLGHVVNQWHGKVVIMGDFNEVRCKYDRFGSHFNVQGANVFNSFIINAGLEEVPIGGSAFTWCHKSMTKMSKLDRFLVSNNLLNICPHISAVTLERYLSDHRPVLLRESIHDYGPVPFRFFHHWLELDGFYTFVSDTWRNAPEDRSNGMKNMRGNLKFLKYKIRKWIKDNRCNRKVAFDKLKEELRLVDEAIDKGVGTKEVVNKRLEVLNSLRYIDEMHAMDLAQKAKIKWSIEGDENSSFFHGMLNKQRNQSNIKGIMVDGVWKEQPNDVKKEFLNNFQERFDKLVIIEEIKTTVWNCGTDKSPGPDGFTFDFYRQFWSTIDKDVYAAVNHFFINEDIPAGCNLSFIALIPKVPNANLVKDFRPISLIGSIYKIIAKILTNSLINVLGDIVSEMQSAFVAGRRILDGLKINLCKSKIMGVNVEGSYVNQAAVKLGCQVLTSPVIYLGTKVGGTMSRVQAWQEVMEKVKTRLSKWKMKMLSVGGRLTLLKSVLGSIPIFHMSIFRVPSKVLQILESIRGRFFNGHEIGSKKVGLMIKVITAIHGVNGNVNSSGGKVGRSCWLAIVDEVRALHKKGVYVFDFMNLKLGNGEMVKFWLDRWFEGGILKDLFPRMFALENMKETQFSKLVELVQSISLMPINDPWVWNLESSGEFSVASIRRIIDELCFLNIGDTTRWVKYVPIKVNIIAWKIKCDVLPTRMNLSRSGIDIQAISCPICDYGVDSSEHLFFRCNMIRNISKQIVRWWNINYEEVS